MRSGMSSGIVARPLAGYIGAQIEGIDLSCPMDEPTFSSVRTALATYGVIFFREQRLTPDQHEVFTGHFGSPTDVRFVTMVEGHAHISEVPKDLDVHYNIGGGWHADQTCLDTPPLGAILVAGDLPDFGGDTLFSSLAAIYEALSPGLQALLDNLEAVDSNTRLVNSKSGKLITARQEVREAIHPVVIRNELTGRKSLFVDRAYTTRFEGWSEAEGAPPDRRAAGISDALHMASRFGRFLGQRTGRALRRERLRRYMHRLAIKAAPLRNALGAAHGPSAARVA